MTKFKQTLSNFTNSKGQNGPTNQLQNTWTGNESQEDLVFHDAYVEGLYGRFKAVDNDFKTQNPELNSEEAGQFNDEPHWSPERREKVKKFRFVIATLVLASIALSLTSRMILNIAVVEMIKTDPVVAILDDIITTQMPTNETTSVNITSEMMITTTSPSSLYNITGDSAPTPAELDLTKSEEVSDELPASEEGLRFDWSKNQVNTLLGSFYIGYSPSILLSGSVVNRFGSRYPLLVVIFGSAILNALTPFIARYSYAALVFSRILMGAIQGSVVPSAYDLFNKWLTRTEGSIFVPLIKVSMPMGSLIGTSLPFLMTQFGFEWPFLFYSGSFICVLWSIVWLLLSSSTPQESKFVEPNELHRIMKKKVAPSKVELATVDTTKTHLQMAKMNASERARAKMLEANGNSVTVKSEQQKPGTASIPWKRIIFCPSVIALTIVKYTYNLGMDFFYLELAVYLREMHNAPIEVISMIASSGYFMQMTLITMVGWLAKNLVNRQAFGLSVTKWRKIFQGTSNLGMAAIYFLFPVLGTDLTTVAALIMTIWFFWMLGAGGESMVPYDLSTKYPAAIVGLAHGLSIFSGLSVPALCTLVLGSETDDENGWNILFIMIGSLLTFGGLVFIFVLKAKPFLPEERIPKQVTVHKISVHRNDIMINSSNNTCNNSEKHR